MARFVAQRCLLIWVVVCAPAWAATNESRIVGGRYVVGRRLSNPALSAVHSAVDLTTGHAVALKQIDTSRDSWERELEIHQILKNHARIVTPIDSIVSGTRAFLVTELVPRGTLDDLIARHGRLNESDACRILLQVQDALVYCYRHGVAHLDVKGSNILIDANGNAKLADFGASRRMGPRRQVLLSNAGTPGYQAPEVSQDWMVARGEPADVWSLGVVLHEMVTGEVPQRNGKGALDLPDYLSADARDLLRRMLRLSRHRRIRLIDIDRHPFCNAVHSTN